MPVAHTAVPVAHEYVPVLQLLFREHAPPAVQLQLPLPSQYRFPPQLVPAAALTRLEHTGAPVEHEFVPVLQPLFTAHAPPAVQLQLPLPSQYRFPPQLVPAAAFARLEPHGDAGGH